MRAAAMVTGRRPVAFEDPFVITPEMEQVAAEAAARDAADLDSEWAALSEDERSWFGSSFGELPDCDDVAAVEGGGDAVRMESAYVRSLAAGGGSPAEWLPVAAAIPGSLGLPSDDSGVLPDPGDALAQLQVIDRLAAWVASRRYAVVAAACPEPVDEGSQGFRREQHLVEEIAVATRTGTGTAAALIDTARLVSTPEALFAPFAAALADGAVSEAHVRVLVRGTARITGPNRDQVLTAVAQRVLPSAMIATPAQLEKAVTAAVCAVDPEGEADRRAAAREARDVYRWPDQGNEPGTETLATRDDAARVQAMYDRITREARRLQRARGGTTAVRHGQGDARLGVCRTDVLAAMVLGTDPTASGAATTTQNTVTSTTGVPSVTTTTPASTGAGGSGMVPGDAAAVLAQGMLEPVRPVFECQLVMDLATLRRERDGVCLLDGEPIPAAVARELLASVTAWRRMVTDPVTGHLLDYGHKTYLPEPLVRFTKARDGQCAAPYCQRPASRCQMDHHVPHPVGPSNTTNCGALCDRHHPLKTEGYMAVTNSRPDGSATFTTAWGHSITTSPRPYLPDGGNGRPGIVSTTGGTNQTGPPSGRLRATARRRPTMEDDDPLF